MPRPLSLDLSWRKEPNRLQTTRNLNCFLIHLLNQKTVQLSQLPVCSATATHFSTTNDLTQINYSFLVDDQSTDESPSLFVILASNGAGAQQPSQHQSDLFYFSIDSRLLEHCAVPKHSRCQVEGSLGDILTCLLVWQ